MYPNSWEEQNYICESERQEREHSRRLEKMTEDQIREAQKPDGRKFFYIDEKVF